MVDNGEDYLDYGQRPVGEIWRELTVIMRVSKMSFAIDVDVLETMSAPNWNVSFAGLHPGTISGVSIYPAYSTEM